MMNKSGQGWGFDLVVASGIFFLAIIFFYLFIVNNSQEGEVSLERLTSESQLLSDSFLSEGYPLNWDLSNISRIGVVSGGRINETKLVYFKNLSSNNYSLTRVLFGISSNYFVNFSESIALGGESVIGFGNVPPENSNVIRSSRYSIYQNKPVQINIFIWQN